METMKMKWGNPMIDVQQFNAQEYCANCEWSQHDSPDGDHVYGWVLKCERVTYGGVTYGHKIDTCPDERTYTGDGPKDGNFVMALNQSESTQFSINNVKASNAFWLDYDGNNTLNVGDYWIIDGHAYKVSGTGQVSYPYSKKYLVNHS